MTFPRLTGSYLVGSVPLRTVKEVFCACSEHLGGRLAAFPDGELDDRTLWVVFVAYRKLHGHPQIETLQRPAPIDGVEQWKTDSFDNFWRFRVKDGEKLHLEDLGYVEAARKSYETFRRLRDEGVIPLGARFKVALPNAASLRIFFLPDQYAQVTEAYTDALERELVALADAIPHEDLSVQLDTCVEVLEAEGALPPGSPEEATALDRYVAAVARLTSVIPAAVELCVHFCYGDLGHRHVTEPKDMAVMVDMANVLVQHAARPVDGVHMPVPIERTNHSYYEPLQDLNIGDTQLALGVVHHGDGFEGAQRRIQVAGQYVGKFAIATECGFGRRDPDQVHELLALHAELLDAAGTVAGPRVVNPAAA